MVLWFVPPPEFSNLERRKLRRCRKDFIIARKRLGPIVKSKKPRTAKAMIYQTLDRRRKGPPGVFRVAKEPSNHADPDNPEGV